MLSIKAGCHSVNLPDNLRFSRYCPNQRLKYRRYPRFRRIEKISGMAHVTASPPPTPSAGRGPVQNAFSSARFPMRQSYAALDLGTNNCRMLIARPDGDGFTILDAFSRIVRLGEGLGASGKLSDIAMDRAVAALAICADKLQRKNVTLARSVATEACRRASNGAEFVDRVYAETGIKLDVISTEEEARLAVIGCHRLLEAGDGPALVFDIGGGSTELVSVDTRSGVPVMLDWLSGLGGSFRWLKLKRKITSVLTEEWQSMSGCGRLCAIVSRLLLRDNPRRVTNGGCSAQAAPLPPWQGSI
jgi:hypothetical protein